MRLVDWYRFQTCVKRYHGDVKTHALTTQEFFKIMAFAQITGRESLRETVLCLNAVPTHLYHLGLPRQLIRSNIDHRQATLIDKSCPGIVLHFIQVVSNTEPLKIQDLPGWRLALSVCESREHRQRRSGRTATTKGTKKRLLLYPRLQSINAPFPPQHPK